VPYVFGVNVSIATTLLRLNCGQLANHGFAPSPWGILYDGRTLAIVIPDTVRSIGNGIPRILIDAGYSCHDGPLSFGFKF
jgi:hypothetical protein